MLRELWDTQENKDIMITLSWLKNRDILLETVLEYERRGDFVRIFPAWGSDFYDQFFSYQRPIQKFIYNFLFEDEIIPKRGIKYVSKPMPNYEKY